MHRRASLILLALAVFFAALSPLLRWYAFPRLAKIPAGQYQDMVLEAKGATLLDYGTMKARKVSKVTIVQTLKGNVAAAKQIERTAGRDVVVWDGLSYVQGPDGKMVSEIPERYIFDAHSQEPVHATGEAVDGDPVKRDGIEFKWPFLTEKRDYEYFDAQTRTTHPIHYKGTTTFRGVEVYYFEQTIPWTQVRFPKVMPVKGITPESVAKTGTTRWYTTVRKFWVEPVTGAPVYGEEIHKEELRGGTLLGGRDKVTAFAGHVKMREDYIRHTVALVKSNRTLVLLMTSYLPWGFLILGTLLLALSLWLEARARRPADPAPAAAEAPQPVSA
ncbi:PorA family protein [Streptomyces sp. YIM S03343]